MIDVIITGPTKAPVMAKTSEQDRSPSERNYPTTITSHPPPAPASLKPYRSAPSSVQRHNKQMCPMRSTNKSHHQQHRKKQRIHKEVACFAAVPILTKLSKTQPHKFSNEAEHLFNTTRLNNT